MTTVWIVLGCLYGETEIISVHATPESAAAARDIADEESKKPIWQAPLVHPIFGHDGKWVGGDRAGMTFVVEAHDVIG